MDQPSFQLFMLFNLLFGELHLKKLSRHLNIMWFLVCLFSIGDVFQVCAPSKIVAVPLLSSAIYAHPKYSSSVPNTSQVRLESCTENVVVCLSFHKSFLAALEPEKLTEMASCQVALRHFCWGGGMKQTFMVV